MPDDDHVPPYAKFALGLFGKVIDGPVTWFREKVVVPNQQKGIKYYHRRFRRVPNIDECYTDDVICRFEASEQYKRDKLVDNHIVQILRNKRSECYRWEGPDAAIKCVEVVREYEEAATNWFIKYGDLPANSNVADAYMKQKHRLIYERRHGRKLY